MANAPESNGLENLQASIRAIAADRHDDSTKLLELLRVLEAAHREVRDGPFAKTLPGSRHELYHFLLAIEEKGGWPYIPRLSLRHLLAQITAASPESPAADGNADTDRPSPAADS